MIKENIDSKTVYKSLNDLYDGITSVQILANSQFGVKTVFWKIFLIIAGILILSSGLDKILDWAFEQAFTFEPLAYLGLLLSIVYYIRVAIKNKRPDTDVIILTDNSLSIYTLFNQWKDHKQFSTKVKIDYSEISVVKLLPSNFVTTKVNVELNDGTILFLEQNSFWDIKHFVGRNGAYIDDLVPELKKRGVKTEKASAFTKFMVNVIYLIELILPFVIIFMMFYIDVLVKEAFVNA